MNTLLMLLFQSPVAEIAPPLANVTLAGVIFYFYRTDRKSSEKKHTELATQLLAESKRHEDALKSLVGGFLDVVTKSTESLSEMSANMRLLTNGQLADIRAMMGPKAATTGSDREG
jgi:hypothetical protein